MAVFVCDREERARLIARRRHTGADRFDEVWDGVYVMSPQANDEHQDIATKLGTVLTIVMMWSGLGLVRIGGVNISDRIMRWKRNFRCPDIAVFLTACQAVNHETHWFGGPDFGVEIVSKGDRSRKKFGFYAKVGTRELLIVDRYPWALELYVLKGKQLELAGRSTVDDPQTLQSTVLPLRFRLIAGDARPQIEVTRSDGSERWLS
jgi:Uma2 family endonuclease